MRFIKLRMIWGILMGRTVIYRAKIHGLVSIPEGKRSYIVENEFDGMMGDWLDNGCPKLS